MSSSIVTVNVGSSNSISDSHTEHNKQTRRLTRRKPLMLTQSQNHLKLFEKDIDRALLHAQSEENTVLFPMELDPLNVSYKTLMKFAAVYDHKQLHVEIFSDFQRLIFVFRTHGPVNEIDDLILIDITNEDSMWSCVTSEVRNRILNNSIEMSIEMPANVSVDEETNMKTQKFVRETKKIFKSEMYQQQKHTKHKEVRHVIKNIEDNSTTTTIQKETFSETQQKNLKFTIIKRQTQYEELKNNWTRENKALKALRTEKRNWTNALFKNQETFGGKSGAEQKLFKKMFELKRTLKEIDLSIVSMKYEIQELRSCELCENAFDFFNEDLPEIDSTQINIKDAIELAKTVSIPTAHKIHCDDDDENSKSNYTVASVPFENFAEILNISRMRNYTILSGRELAQKQKHLQKESFEHGKLLRKNIREIQQEINRLSKNSQPQNWLETKRKISAIHNKNRSSKKRKYIAGKRAN
jgi:hypothetical protein